MVNAFTSAQKEIAPDIELRLKAHVGEWGTAKDVSKEYLRLYESQCLTAEELENIRKNGLKPISI